MVICDRAFSYYVRLSRLKSFVEDHYAERISLSDAANIVGLEAKYFSSFFRQKTGVCFRDWIGHVRVEKAKQLFHSRNRSITDVAYAVGCGDLRTFERVFKKHTMMTPREFKRTVRPC